MASERFEGTVVRWLPERSFGFIRPDSGDADLFIHVTRICGDGRQDLQAGQRVTYSIGPGRRGPEARDVEATGEVVRHVGTICRWLDDCGFIRRDAEADAFVHELDVRSQRSLPVGTEVSFVLVPARRGPRAVDVVEVTG